MKYQYLKAAALVRLIQPTRSPMIPIQRRDFELASGLIQDGERRTRVRKTDNRKVVSTRDDRSYSRAFQIAHKDLRILLVVRHVAEAECRPLKRYSATLRSLLRALMLRQALK